MYLDSSGSEEQRGSAGKGGMDGRVERGDDGRSGGGSVGGRMKVGSIEGVSFGGWLA